MTCIQILFVPRRDLVLERFFNWCVFENFILRSSGFFFLQSCSLLLGVSDSVCTSTVVIRFSSFYSSAESFVILHIVCQWFLLFCKCAAVTTNGLGLIYDLLLRSQSSLMTIWRSFIQMRFFLALIDNAKKIIPSFKKGNEFCVTLQGICSFSVMDGRRRKLTSLIKRLKTKLATKGSFVSFFPALWIREKFK